MCKLMTITGNLSRKQVETALVETRGLFAKTQADGFGFLAANTRTGQSAYGRYLRPSSFFGFGATQSIPESLTGPMIECGQLPKTTNVLIMHGRTSTNHVRVENVHPFKRKHLYLAHNGILNWLGDKAKEPSAAFGCDTESLLNWIVDGGDISESAKLWSGYGAIFIYDDKKRKLRLAKCETSRLSVAKRESAGYVASTDGGDGMKVAKKIGIKMKTGPLPVPKLLIEFNDAGDIESDKPWSGFGSRVRDGLFYSSYGGLDTANKWTDGHGVTYYDRIQVTQGGPEKAKELVKIADESRAERIKAFMEYKDKDNNGVPDFKSQVAEARKELGMDYPYHV